MRVFKSCHLLVVLSLICLITACNDDDCPTCPDPQKPPTPSLSNIWPNEDGNAWTYDLISTMFSVPLDQGPGDPPPMPPLEDLYADLSEPVEGDLVSTAQGLFRLEFDGMKTTDSGVTAQNVTETVYVDPWAEKSTEPGVEPTSTGQVVTSDGSDLLLRRIAQARPDLRDKIARQFGVSFGVVDSLDVSEIPDFPFFLYGYAWSKESTGVFSYGDLDTDHSWIYLESDLSVGHTFQMQLVPMLADDIYLYGQIWSHGSFIAGGLQFENCVECMYAVDFGIQEATDENGQIIARFSSWSYGVIVYAPGIGPVYSHEKQMVGPNLETSEENGMLVENLVDYVGATQGGS